MPYTIKTKTVNNVVQLGRTNVKATPKPVETKIIDVAKPAPVELPKFSIEGTVFEDKGDAVLDTSEMPLAGWTLNLEKPAGTVINSTTTNKDGKFAFTGLVAGKYSVAEVVQEGWKIIFPSSSRATRTLTNESPIACMVFANQILPPEPIIEVPIINATVPEAVTVPTVAIPATNVTTPDEITLTAEKMNETNVTMPEATSPEIEVPATNVTTPDEITLPVEKMNETNVTILDKVATLAAKINATNATTDIYATGTIV
jgi:hypothetical protein